jgi:hypothetical protein
MANVRTISGTVNTDQNSAAEARFLGSGSSASVGRQPPHAGRLGAGPQQTARPRPHNSPQHPQRSHGGQTGLDPFGIADHAHAEHVASHAKAKAPSTPPADDRPQLVGGLSIGQRCRPAKTIAFQLLKPDGTLWETVKLDARLVRKAQAYGTRYGRTFEELVREAIELFAGNETLEARATKEAA